MVAPFGIDESGPAGSAAEITPSDDTVLAPTRALYIGTTGDVAVRMYRSQNAVTFVAVPAGAFLPIQVDKVLAATDADDIVAVW